MVFAMDLSWGVVLNVYDLDVVLVLIAACLFRL
jgi:hypothetical protein